MNPTADLTHVIRHLRSEPEDPVLLDRYARGNDQAAFAGLVRRYGPLVFGVARRQLADRHQAEDVFQATFLALARSATRLERRPMLANWLYTVALRQARKARARDARRGARERGAPLRPSAGGDPLDAITGRELLQAVDYELARLPDRLRFPVLLCCVQGLSREDAARRLGVSVGAVRGRLERGRQQLAARLAARGLAPTALILATLATAAVSADLLARATEQAANPWSAAVPAAVAELATSGPPRALLSAAVLAGGALAAGLIGWALVAAPAPANPASVDRGTAAAPVSAPDLPPADPLPDGATRRFGTSRFRHPTTIGGLAVSADGKIAVAHSGGRIGATVRAYDLATGRAKYAIEREPGGRDVEGVAFAPDGKTVALKRDHAVFLHAAATGEPTGHIDYPKANPSTITDLLTFSPDGKFVVVAAAEGKALHLLDIAKREVARTLPHAHVVFAAAFSPDGKHLVGGGYDSEKDVHFARVWDVATGQERLRLPFGSGGIRSVAYAPDGATVAIGWDGGKSLAVKLFASATGKERLRIPFPEASSVWSVAFSPDGKTLAASGGSATRLFDTATGRELVKIDGKAIGLRFTPDGKSLVGAVAGTIYRWDAATGQSLIPNGGDSPVGQVVATADDRLVTRGQDGDAHVWDAKTGEHLRRVHVGWQRGMALSPDGRYLVWPVGDDTVRFKDPDEPNAIHTGSRLQLFDLTAGQLVERFGGFEGDAHNLFFSANGKTLVTVDHRDATVRFWDVAPGKVVRSFRAGEKGARHQVWRATLSPDGKVLAVTYQPAGRGFFAERAVKLWDTATGKELHHLPGHQNYVEVMAFSPDGKYLLTGCEALSAFAQEQLKRPVDQVFVWDVGTGTRVASLPIGGTAGAFAPDGKTVAVATADGTIQFRDVATWKVRASSRGRGRGCSP